MPAGPSPTAFRGVGLAADLNDELDSLLADDDARRLTDFPGEPSSRQPVHTVYVPADRFDARTPQRWGEQAATLLERFAPDPETLALRTGLPVASVAAVHDRVLAKLAAEPVEDLRIDFEDGFGQRQDSVEDGYVERAIESLGTLTDQGRRPPFVGIRFKSFEAPTRHRGVRTLAAFLAGLSGLPEVDGAAGAESQGTGAGQARADATRRLPAGLVVTLPKVTSVDQVRAMVHVCQRLEDRLGLPPQSVRFEIQVETAQAVLGADGVATVATMVHAAAGRCSGLHYGTYDYSAGLGIAAAHQSLDHPAADHAKAVMQVAAAQTGVRLSDGSTNVVAFDDADQAGATWSLHARLVTRALQRGYYQGWDLHPGHLPTRYLATYIFYREALPATASRLRAYLSATDDGAAGVLDEPATARALATALLRGARCGALDEDEVESACGVDVAALAELTTTGSGRRRPSGSPQEQP